MSKSHLTKINELLSKKALHQDQVEVIETHFRNMSDIQDTVEERQRAFDTFQKRVEDEGACVITLTPEELLHKGIHYKKSLTRQAAEAVQAVNTWLQAKADWYASFSYMMSDDLLDDYANTTTREQQQEQEPQSIASHTSSSSENYATIKTRMHQELNLFFTESATLKQIPRTTNTPVSAYTHETLDDLKSTLHQACDVLRAYLVEEDKEAFNTLMDDMMQIVDDLSSNSDETSIDKSAMMDRIDALKNKLKPQNFYFEGQGGLDDEQISLWFTVKFWLCSTLKSILNAADLRSSANFFTPALSEAEQVKINRNLANLTDAVGQFENTMKNSYPDPDSDSEAEPDSDAVIRPL